MALTLVALATLGAGGASAAPTVTEITGGVTPGFSANGVPWGITAGPDGSMWFTQRTDPGRVAQITPAGQVTEFAGGTTLGFSANADPTDIATGPDGSLWFTGQANPGRIGRFDFGVTELTGGLTPGFSINSLPTGITAGPDGNIWVTQPANPGRVARVTPAGVVTQFTGGVTPGFSINSIPDRHHRRPRRQPLVHRPRSARPGHPHDPCRAGDRAHRRRDPRLQRRR